MVTYEIPRTHVALVKIVCSYKMHEEKIKKTLFLYYEYIQMDYEHATYERGYLTDMTKKLMYMNF